MNREIKQVHIKDQVARIAQENDIPTSKEEAEAKGLSAYLSTDYYAPPNLPYKWKLVVVGIPGGAKWDFTHYRMTTYGFSCFLDGMELSIKGAFTEREKWACQHAKDIERIKESA